MSASVIYILVNSMGGITTMLQNISRYSRSEGLPQRAILLDIKENPLTPIGEPFGDIPNQHFAFSKKDNWYVVMRKLANLCKQQQGGVIIANDIYEMIMLHAMEVPQKMVQIIHDGYNVQLALQYGEVVDKFVCHTRFFYEVMGQLLPHRRADIVHIPYGVKVDTPKRNTRNSQDPLKLFFLGRHDEAKGIFELRKIDQLLQQAGIPVTWLILGKGPLTDSLKNEWAGVTHVEFQTPASNADVIKAIAQRDIFIFPTRFEGFPVALMEAMSVGAVPVASDLPGGLREIVHDAQTGFRVPMDQPEAFANAVIRLWNDPELLEQISRNNIELVSQQFNVTIQSPLYQQFFDQTAALPEAPRHHRVKQKIGSRLDQPWLPNFVTRFLRRH